MKLSELTDADITDLLAFSSVIWGPLADEDILACEARGWLYVDRSEVSCSGGLCWGRSWDDGPVALLAEAQRIADGRGDWPAGMMTSACCEASMQGPDWCCACDHACKPKARTPAGRLVLALRERRETR